MAAVNVNTFVTRLQGDALPPYGQGKCARHVRIALEAAGAQIAVRELYAKNWGSTLIALGYEEVDVKSVAEYRPAKGDIAVIQSTSASVAGHIQAYDGTAWVSDFTQAAFWPGPSYRNEKPSFKVYRR